MTLTAQLAQLIDDPGVAASVLQLVEKLLTDTREELACKAREIEHRSLELHAAQTKIQALTLELAHLPSAHALRGEERNAPRRGARPVPGNAGSRHRRSQTGVATATGRIGN